MNWTTFEGAFQSRNVITAKLGSFNLMSKCPMLYRGTDVCQEHNVSHHLNITQPEVITVYDIKQ